MNVDFAKISAHKGPEVSPGYLLWKTSTLWRRAIEQALKPLKLTHPQFVVLAAIGWLNQSGNGLIRQVEIGRFCGLDPNTTSQILRSLHTKKLITRKAQDGRSKSPILTAAGSALLTEAIPIVEKEDHAFFHTINPEKTPLLKALQTLSSRDEIKK
ncbi:MAG: MarR family transcriptional regulator [Verrucomicrobia bacterium]|nr:MarR family transcriptional regulator [Verrucomicrobiota bacterium]MBS0637215.1 MarR family transcriptional regulator [Verrucomicrobiota bacterium]